MGTLGKNYGKVKVKGSVEGGGCNWDVAPHPGCGLQAWMGGALVRSLEKARADLLGQSLKVGPGEAGTVLPAYFWGKR
ncbi:hypothetical protein GMLC_36420 [Geomonas limicola]|uniref:Uncharacterized protein n=1 Tax=Geomonas limicola TaxID=2740186 RepID=A0A6V8NER3_9BACT|nr:hypothetical protein GMLC_36420 [Geomonas limicola]